MDGALGRRPGGELHGGPLYKGVSGVWGNNEGAVPRAVPCQAASWALLSLGL